MTHPEPPLAGDETATLLGSLERQHATLAWKCAGLDAGRAAKDDRRLVASVLTKGRHAATNEQPMRSRSKR